MPIVTARSSWLAADVQMSLFQIPQFTHQWWTAVVVWYSTYYIQNVKSWYKPCNVEHTQCMQESLASAPIYSYNSPSYSTFCGHSSNICWLVGLVLYHSVSINHASVYDLCTVYYKCYKASVNRPHFHNLNWHMFWGISRTWGGQTSPGVLFSAYVHKNLSYASSAIFRTCYSLSFQKIVLRWSFSFYRTPASMDELVK